MTKPKKRCYYCHRMKDVFLCKRDDIWVCNDCCEVCPVDYCPQDSDNDNSDERTGDE